MSTWIIPDAPASPLSIFRDRGMRRFWLRSLLAPCVAMRWRDHALRLYGLHGTAIPNAAVLSKPLHGYLRRGLNPAERLRLLIDHYCLFSDLTGPDCLRAFCAGESVELALLAGRKGTQFRVFLVSSSVVQTQREGECAVCLQRVGNPMLLSRLSFTFFLDDGGLGLAIGGLQGPAPGHKRQVIEATRDLYGLRQRTRCCLLPGRSPRLSRCAFTRSATRGTFIGLCRTTPSFPAMIDTGGSAALLRANLLVSYFPHCGSPQARPVSAKLPNG